MKFSEWVDTNSLSLIKVQIDVELESTSWFPILNFFVWDTDLTLYWGWAAAGVFCCWLLAQLSNGWSGDNPSGTLLCQTSPVPTSQPFKWESNSNELDILGVPAVTRLHKCSCACQPSSVRSSTITYLNIESENPSLWKVGSPNLSSSLPPTDDLIVTPAYDLLHDLELKLCCRTGHQLSLGFANVTLLSFLLLVCSEERESLGCNQPTYQLVKMPEIFLDAIASQYSGL